MADVGVLELQIQDNGKAAGGGLTSLYNALSKVQKAVGNGLDLSGVATQVTTLAQTINAAKGTSTVVKNLGTLFNAISKFSNIKDFKINKQPFEDLKAAIGEGFNIGTAGTQINALRTALTEGWGDGSGIAAIKEAHNAAKGIGKNDATKIRDMADAVSKYAKSIEELKNASNGVGDWRMMMSGAPSSNITGPISDNVRDEAIRKSSRMKLNLQFFAEKSKADAGLDEVKKATEPIAEGFEYIERSVSEATASVNNFANSSKEALTASKNIKNLISYLDAGENRKSRGFSHVVDAYTGVSKPLTNLAEESAKAFDDKFFERIDRVNHFFESLDKPKSSMGWSSEAFDKILGVGREMEKISDETSSMFNIPAMDKEGPFKYAYEEIQYYSEKLSEAQTAMNAFDEAAKRIQKDMKFKGSTEAQEKDLARMNESFYAAYEEAEKYKEALDGVLGYANQYSETVGEVTQATQAQAEAVREVVSTTEDADKFANRLQNIVTLAESWKSIPKDQRGDFFNIFKTDPLTTGVLEKLQDLKGDNLGEFAARIREIVESSAEGTDKVAQLNELLQTFGTTQPAEALAESVNKTAGALDNAGKAAQGFANAVHGMNGLATLAESSMGEVERLVGMSDIDLMTMKLDALKHALAEDISTGRLDSQQMTERAMTIKHLAEKIEELKEAQEGLNSRVKSGKSGWDSFTDGLKKAFPLIERIRSQFGRIVLRRALTAVIRQIAAGFKEGVQNVYEYSKAVGTSFAPAMDAAASAIAQMKNSIGAAVAPAIQALIPLLQTVVSWFITAVNYVNQFFALLNGQSTWTRALPQTVKAFDNQKKAAKGAANAMKDLLADWDELNIIQSNTAGGAGGGAAQAAEDYLSMFEEVDKFDDKVKWLTDFVKDNLTEIEALAGAIGTALIGWKLSNAFAKELPLLSKIATGFAAAGTIAISLLLTDLTGKAFADTGNPVWLIADALTGAVGAYLAGKLVTKIAGGAAGTVTTGFTLILEGAVNIKNAVSAMSDQQEGRAWALGALGSIEAGIGSALVAKGLGATVTGSILAGTATFGFTALLTAAILLDAKRAASYKQMAMDAFRKTGENGISAEDYLAELQARFDELTKNAHLVIDPSIELEDSQGKFKESIESLKSLSEWIGSGESLTEAQATDFKNAWEIVFNELDRMGKLSYETIFQGLTLAIQEGTKETKEAATELKKQAIEIARMTGGARAAAQEEMSQIVSEISSGNMDNIERYTELYNIWGEGGETTEKIQKHIDDALAQSLKFTEGGDAVQESRDFLSYIHENMIAPAIDLADQELAAEKKAIEEQRDELMKAWKSGYIDETQYNNSMAGLDRISVLFDQSYNEQLERIQKASDNAYDMIAEQLYQGYFDIKDDPAARQGYIDNIIKPVLEIYEEAKKEIPQRLKNIIALDTEGTHNSANIKELVESSGRKDMYKMIYDEIMKDEGYQDAVNAAWKIIASEGLNLEGAADNLTEQAQQEIVNSLLPLFSEYDAPAILELLHDQLKFDYKTMLSGIDFAGLNGGQYMKNGELVDYESMDLIDAINQFIEEYNFDNPEHAIQAIDMSKFDEGFENSIEVMDEWKKTVDEMENAGNNTGMAGKINPNRITAAGAFSDTRPSRSYVNGRPAAEVQMDQQSMTNAVESGTKKANAVEEDLIRQLVRVVEQIARKDFTVNVNPSAAWGGMNVRSGIARARVTGAIPMEE